MDKTNKKFIQKIQEITELTDMTFVLFSMLFPYDSSQKWVMLLKKIASHHEFYIRNTKITHEKYRCKHKHREMHSINYPNTIKHCSFLRDSGDKPNHTCSLADLSSTQLVSSCSVPLEAHHKISRISLFKDRSRQKTFLHFYEE